MIKCLLLLLNIISIFGLLMAYLSPFISPAVWYIPQLFGLFYPYLFLLNLCFFFFWLIFKWTYAKYSFIVMLIGFGFLSRAYKWYDASTPDKKEIVKLLTYNVKSFGIVSDKNILNPKPLFEFVNMQDADITCFQEYNNSRYKKYGDPLLKKLYPYNHINGELATLTKFPILNKQNISFDKKHYARGILTDILIKNDTIRIINLHLESNQLSSQNKKDFEEVVSQKQGIEKLRTIAGKLKRASFSRAVQVEKIVNIIENSPYEIIVCGDFNDTPLSYCYERINNHLNDSFVQSGKNLGLTFSEGNINVRIDYIFSRTPMYGHQVHSVEFSDHKPVTSSICLNLE